MQNEISGYGLCKGYTGYAWKMKSGTGKYNHHCDIFHPHRKQSNDGRNFVQLTFDRHFIWCYILLCVILLLNVVNSQTVKQEVRPFPSLFNAAQNRPVITEPSQSTCGINSRSAYCKSSTFPISVEMCNQDFCIQTCPGRTRMPIYYSLLPPTGGFSSCVVADTINRRPGSDPMSFSTSFISQGPTCFLTPTVNVTLGSKLEFSFTLWIWPEKNNNG